jgi:hypothetical protein
MAIPTGGRRRDGTLNTHRSASGVVAMMRNEKPGYPVEQSVFWRRKEKAQEKWTCLTEKERFYPKVCNASCF